MRDTGMEYIRKRLYLNPFNLNALIAAAETGTLTEGQILQNPTSATKTAPDWFLKKVLSTLDLVGLGVRAVSLPLLCGIRIPFDLDPKFPVGFRVNFTNINASAGTATFVIATEIISDAGSEAFNQAVNDALDTAIGVSASTAQYRNAWTGRGIKKSLGVTRPDLEAGAWLMFNLTLSAVATIAATDVIVLGVELDYVPWLTVGNGKEVDCPTLHTGVK